MGRRVAPLFAPVRTFPFGKRHGRLHVCVIELYVELDDNVQPSQVRQNRLVARRCRSLNPA